MNKMEEKNERLVYDFTVEEMAAIMFSINFLRKFMNEYVEYCIQEKISPEKSIELINPVIPEQVFMFMLSERSKDMVIRIKETVERSMTEDNR